MAAPVVFAVMAATKLFGDLMNQQAQRRKEKAEQEYQGIQAGYNTWAQGAKNMGEAQQSTVNDIIQQYRGLA